MCPNGRSRFYKHADREKKTKKVWMPGNSWLKMHDSNQVKSVVSSLILLSYWISKCQVFIYIVVSKSRDTFRGRITVSEYVFVPRRNFVAEGGYWITLRLSVCPPSVFSNFKFSQFYDSGSLSTLKIAEGGRGVRAILAKNKHCQIVIWSLNSSTYVCKYCTCYCT